TEYADEGDFASVGSVHVSYRDTIADQVALSTGAFDYQRAFTAGSNSLGAGNLLGALELTHYDGPWTTPGDQRKFNGLLRYSAGTPQVGYSLTASLYHSLWNNQTDVPERAITEGLIGRFGQLDPTDQGRAQRANFTAEEHQTLGAGELSVSGYVFSNHLTLINDFTHFLIDPVNGDQEQQHEDRTTLGGAASYRRPATLLGRDSELLLGFQARYDFLQVARIPTRNAQPIPAADHPLGFSEDDQIHLASDAWYAQASTHWSPWFRSVIGLREDYVYGSDSGSNPGSASRALLQPKASLIFRLAAGSELYFSAGRGFHSDDLRGVNQARLTHTPGAPLLASQTGEEIGLRQELFAQRLAATVAVFNLDAQSEITYNPDEGMDSAGPGSHRIGYEINATYQALRWLEFYGSFSQDRARYTTAFDDGTGHVGFYLPNAPFATGSLNVYVKNLGHWSGGLEYRYLGAFPLSSDDRVQGSGYGEWSGDIHYALAGGWGVAVGVFNILNSHANAMEYWYVDRLPGEPAEGQADIHVHPLEPRALRLTVSKNF
ncbi:MAG TPA: TonB-dependent receptor, partial [Steroidobacteraceae bacterium]